ncbi:MAG: glycosyltransferase family 2 protein [Acidimicrobiales bacterium]
MQPVRRFVLPSTLVVIPALNEEATVGSVVTAVLTHLGSDVLVVDDGSSDRTATVARKHGAQVIQHPFNLGVGAALRSGFRFAAERGYQAVVQVDADGQHDPAEALRLLARLGDDELDLVIGSRFDAGYRVGRGRRAVMRLLSREVSRRLGVRVSDTTSGFRAFGPRAIDRFARAYPSAYLSDTVEALLLAGDWHLRVAEEPVVMHPRAGGRASSGPARSVLHLIRLVLVIALHSVRRPIAERGFVGDVEA